MIQALPLERSHGRENEESTPKHTRESCWGSVGSRCHSGSLTAPCGWNRARWGPRGGAGAALVGAAPALVGAAPALRTQRALPGGSGDGSCPGWGVAVPVPGADVPCASQGRGLIAVLVL